MELREIEIFLVLADELHFGRTAERLHLSTARVSQTIGRLERRLGTRLFDRTSRRVELSPVGRRLYEDLRPVFAQMTEGIERAMTAGREVQGVLRVGFFRAAAGRFVLAVAEDFQRRYPGCEVQIRENQLSDGLRLLREDEIDLLLLMLPMQEPDLSAGPVLIREPRVLAVGVGHPLAGRPSVSMDVLSRHAVLVAPEELPDYLRESVVPERTPAGVPIRRGPSFATIQEMLSLVGAGRGVYPVPAHTSRYYARPDVTYLTIVDAPSLEWAFTWRRAAETGRIRAFNACAVEIVDAAKSDKNSDNWFAVSAER